ncbi:MAG: hypothetical protein OXD33_06920 [Rhodobacteraceae bacterium]|nr:hypothetical protein [Paracoccaceae bacterium]
MNRGYSACALAVGIHTQGDSMDDIGYNVREVVNCAFDNQNVPPRVTRLHFVREEVLVA